MVLLHIACGLSASYSWTVRLAQTVRGPFTDCPIFRRAALEADSLFTDRPPYRVKLSARLADYPPPSCGLCTKALPDLVMYFVS
jgi:hypothetical protein